MTPEPTPPGGFLLEAWHAGLGLIAAAAIWAWNFVTGDIRKLKETTVTKEDFKTYVDTSSQQRQELRTAIIDLYNKQKDAEDRANDRHIEILNAIHESKK